MNADDSHEPTAPDEMPEPEGAPPLEAPQPAHRRKDGPERRPTRRPRKKGLSAVALFLLFGAAPAGVVLWFLVQPEWRREEILSKVPEGAGGRALKAGLCLVVLIVLARVALPAFHGAAAALRAGMAWIRARPRWQRVLLFPAEAFLWLLWFVVQALYAVDAVLILAAAASTLLLVVRILKPEFLPDFLPDILG